MIMKKSGITSLNGLRTVVLFLVDCNCAFKHVGRAMMQMAEMVKALAPEQYGSRKLHHAIHLAVNKALTCDLMHQFKGLEQSAQMMQSLVMTLLVIQWPP
jgi:hypothetical protein